MGYTPPNTHANACRCPVSALIPGPRSPSSTSTSAQPSRRRSCGASRTPRIRLPTKDYWAFRDLITGRPTAPRLRRLPRPLPLDRADPVEPDRRRAQRVRGHRRRIPQEQRHPARAALQPDEAQPRRRAGPRPHHRRGAARHGPRDPGVSAGSGRAHLLPRSIVRRAAERDHRRQGDRLAAAAAWSASTLPVP